MKRYFDECRTEEELKQAYRKEARRLHPDNGGSDAEFQEMKNQFDQAFERLQNIHQAAGGGTWNGTGTKYENGKTAKQAAAEFMAMIDQLLKYPDLQIEIIGRWIWVTGNTRGHADLLKTLGFRFSRNKAAWYFHAEPYRKRGKTSKSLDEIRHKYGSVKINPETADAAGADVATA